MKSVKILSNFTMEHGSMQCKKKLSGITPKLKQVVWSERLAKVFYPPALWSLPVIYGVCMEDFHAWMQPLSPAYCLWIIEHSSQRSMYAPSPFYLPIRIDKPDNQYLLKSGLVRHLIKDYIKNQRAWYTSGFELWPSPRTTFHWKWYIMHVARRGRNPEDQNYN